MKVPSAERVVLLYLIEKLERYERFANLYFRNQGPLFHKETVDYKNAHSFTMHEIEDSARNWMKQRSWKPFSGTTLVRAARRVFAVMKEITYHTIGPERVPSTMYYLYGHTMTAIQMREFLSQYDEHLKLPVFSH